MCKETASELLERLVQEQEKTNELLQAITALKESDYTAKNENKEHKKIKKEISLDDIPQAKPYQYNEKTEEMIKLFILQLFLEKKVNSRLALSLLKDLIKEVEKKENLLEENYFNRKKMGLYQSGNQ
ncbi:hypothetical protein QQG09_08355 [Melissococcus plutonius]|uniref:hypothetical protein n=1 Tax=Melissococcus plutonius TaxID=33970 RepID=UPI0021E5384B|nr:hypothetical protein [Melissococcus plutonius]MCV2520390.1 hypothetical protein [Melissococcus plutonius]